VEVRRPSGLVTDDAKNASPFGAAANILTLACGRWAVASRHGVGAVPCPPSFLAQSHIARLLRDHVAKAGPLAVQLMALAASDATLQTAVRGARMGSAAVPVTCDLLPVWLWSRLDCTLLVC
jgi:hypothetical protein